MTDQEYQSLLAAFARKHLRYPAVYSMAGAVTTTDVPRYLSDLLGYVSDTYKLLMTSSRGDNPQDIDRLTKQLADSPVRIAAEQLEACGILDALDDAPDLIMGELRRSSILKEDEEYLANAGFSAEEIEVLLAIAIHKAHALSQSGKMPSDIVEESVQQLDFVVKSSLLRPNSNIPHRKRRKVFNGIGKMLGGAIAGIGNVLLLTGTLVAPNPATAYGAIASGGIAISSFFAGLGDLRGE